MRVFEQQLFLIIEAIRTTPISTLHRPKLIHRGNSFFVISLVKLEASDIIVCSLSFHDLSDGLKSSTWAAIERYVRMNFEWQKTVTP